MHSYTVIVILVSYFTVRYPRQGRGVIRCVQPDDFMLATDEIAGL